MGNNVFMQRLARGVIAVAMTAVPMIVPMLQGPETALSAAVEKPTHVVLKLEPGVDIGAALTHANTANGLKGEAWLAHTFPQTTIHILSGHGWDPKAVAGKVGRLDGVVWSEAGIITPTVEMVALQDKPTEQSSATGYEQLSATATEGFSQASFEQFSTAAFEQFSASAFEQFSAAAFEQFSAAAFEAFSQAFFEAFSQAVFEQFSAAVFEGFSQAFFEAFSQAFFEGFSQAFFEGFSQAFFEAFSQAAFEQLSAAMAAALEAPALRSAIDEMATELILAIRAWQQTAAENQAAMVQINAPGAKNLATGAGVVVAVVDTGIEADHWFLEGAVIQGGVDLVGGDLDPTDEGDGVDNDGNGYADEGVGHGTFIAGLVHLVAPEAKLLPIRVQDSDGGGWSFIVAEGIYKAVDAGADVINISLSIPEKSWVLEEAIQYARDAGVVIVAAAGNYGVLGDLFPAASNFKNVLGVAAVDSDGRRATFSNYGTRTVDVAAPGVQVYGPYPGGTGMATWSGTSFSAGFVSGEVALALEKYGSGPKAAGAATWTANQVLGIDPDSEFMGSGLIDAVGAVTLTADSEAFDTVWDGKMSASTSDGSTITGSGVESIGGPNTGTPADPPVDDKHKGKKSRVERFTDRIGRYMDRITTAAAKIETAYADGKEKKAYRYQSRINKLMSAIQKLVAKIEKYEGEG